MVLTHIKKIMRSMLCVTGVYLGDITGPIDSILHVKVSRPRVCSSCFFLLLLLLLFFYNFFTPSAIAVILKRTIRLLIKLNWNRVVQKRPTIPSTTEYFVKFKFLDNT